MRSMLCFAFLPCLDLAKVSYTKVRVGLTLLPYSRRGIFKREMYDVLSMIYGGVIVMETFDHVHVQAVVTLFVDRLIF